MQAYLPLLRRAAVSGIDAVFSSVAALSLAVLLAAVLFIAPSADAQPATPAAGAVRVDRVEVELVAERDAIVPGEALQIGVRIRHDPQWHTYWRNPGDSGLPTQVGLQLPEGFQAGPIRWPAPQRLFIPPLANYGYEGEIVLPMALQAPAAVADGPVTIAAHVSWLMCREVCIPGDADVSLILPVRREGAAAPSRFASLFDEAERRMPQGSIEAQVRADGDTLSIALPGRAAAVEFFPYREGYVDNAAEQVLYALGSEKSRDDGMRLAVRLSEEGRGKLHDSGEAPLAASAGIVVIDGIARELAAQAAAQPLPVGVEFARVAGAASQPPAGQPRGSWLSVFSGSVDAPDPRAAAPGAATSAAVSAVDAGARARTGTLLTSVSALWVAVLFGAVGGLILNLMPCVFPVIGLKMLGFVRSGGQADAASRLGALAFAAGVVVSFWALAALLLALRAGGEAAGWGFQLQSPVFVAAMAMLFVAIGLNFSGVYEIGIAMTRLGSFDTGPRAHPLFGSFASGVLAVLVATPCTAPFMGSAMGFTLASSAFESMLVFTAIALGMAAPYVLLGFFPQALRWLPRPGRWMETFRQALAFPMYATAAWLAWVLGQQAGIDAVFALTIGAVLLALSAWLYGRFVQQRAGGATWPALRPLVGALAVTALAIGLWTAWPGDGRTPAPAVADPVRADVVASHDWQPWSPEQVRRARAAGYPVFVDFTAAWCVTCQVNKRLVLERESIVVAMAERGVVRLQADWTNRDPRITEALARFGRNGVPLYLVYRPDEREPRVLPELLTTGIVREALAGLPTGL